MLNTRRLLFAALALASAHPAQASPKSLSAQLAFDICLTKDFERASALIGGLGWAATDRDTVEFLRAGFLWLGFADDAKPEDQATAAQVARVISVRKGVTAIGGEITIVAVPHGWNCYVKGVPPPELMAEAKSRLGSPVMDRTIKDASYKEWGRDGQPIVGLATYATGGDTWTLLTVNSRL